MSLTTACLCIRAACLARMRRSRTKCASGRATSRGASWQGAVRVRATAGCGTQAGQTRGTGRGAIAKSHVANAATHAMVFGALGSDGGNGELSVSRRPYCAERHRTAMDGLGLQTVRALAHVLLISSPSLPVSGCQTQVTTSSSGGGCGTRCVEWAHVQAMAATCLAAAWVIGSLPLPDCTIGNHAVSCATVTGIRGRHCIWGHMLPYGACGSTSKQAAC